MKKIISIILLGFTFMGNVWSAIAAMPEEPMTIYGNVITWEISTQIRVQVYDSNMVLLKDIPVIWWKYGTDKTFNLDNKVNLTPFSGSLIFKVIGNGLSYNPKVIKWEIASCSDGPVFQMGALCQYNLSIPSLVDLNTSWGGWYSKAKSKPRYATIVTEEELLKNFPKEEDEIEFNSAPEQDLNNMEDNSEENKGNSEEIKIASKDYIRSIKAFNENKKDTITKLNLTAVTIIWDDEYNGTVEKIVNKVNKEFKLSSLRRDMVKYLDNMTTSYWIYNDESIDMEIRQTFKAKFDQDKAKFEKKYEVIKRKDYIINRTLEKRRLERELASK